MAMPVTFDRDWYGKLWLITWRNLHHHFQPMLDHRIAILRKAGMTKKAATKACDGALFQALKSWNHRTQSLHVCVLMSLRKTMRLVNTERRST